MTDLTDRLARVVELCERARKGPWRWSINGNVMAPGSGDVDEICAVYTDDEATGAPNAPAIIAAVNWCRDDAPALLAEVEELRRWAEHLLADRNSWIEWSSELMARCVAKGDAMRFSERSLAAAVTLLAKIHDYGYWPTYRDEVATYLAHHGAGTGEGNDPQT